MREGGRNEGKKGRREGGRKGGLGREGGREHTYTCSSAHHPVHRG